MHWKVASTAVEWEIGMVEQTAVMTENERVDQSVDATAAGMVEK